MAVAAALLIAWDIYDPEMILEEISYFLFPGFVALIWNLGARQQEKRRGKPF